MFKIRDPQLSAITRTLARQCEDDVVAFVKSDFPQDYGRLGEDGTREMAVRCITRARGFGMSQNTDVLGLAALTLILGDDFESREENDWIKGILASKSLDPNAKVAMIFDRLAAQSG